MTETNMVTLGSSVNIILENPESFKTFSKFITSKVIVSHRLWSTILLSRFACLEVLLARPASKSKSMTL